MTRLLSLILAHLLPGAAAAGPAFPGLDPQILQNVAAAMQQHLPPLGPSIPAPVPPSLSEEEGRRLSDWRAQEKQQLLGGSRAHCSRKLATAETLEQTLIQTDTHGNEAPDFNASAMVDFLESLGNGSSPSGTVVERNLTSVCGNSWSRMFFDKASNSFVQYQSTEMLAANAINHAKQIFQDTMGVVLLIIILVWVFLFGCILPLPFPRLTPKAFGIFPYLCPCHSMLPMIYCYHCPLKRIDDLCLQLVGKPPFSGDQADEFSVSDSAMAP